MRTNGFIVIAALLMATAAWSIGGSSIAEAQTVDHYTCYQGRDLRNPKFVPLTVFLADQFILAIADVIKLKYVCAPVDKNGGGIINPAVHLCAYQLKGVSLVPRPQVQVNSQFQASQFEVKKQKLLLVPCTKALL